MKMLVDLFSTDYGLMSLGVIVFMLGMCVWFIYLFMNKIRLGDDPYAQKESSKPPQP